MPGHFATLARLLRGVLVGLSLFCGLWPPLQAGPRPNATQCCERAVCPLSGPATSEELTADEQKVASGVWRRTPALALVDSLVATMVHVRVPLSIVRPKFLPMEEFMLYYVR